MADISSADLMNTLASTQGRDDKSLEKLKVRHEGLVLNTIQKTGVRGADVDLVAANVWVRVWQMAQRGSWNPSRGRSSDPFLPLLVTITKNLAKDCLRRNSRDRRNLRRLEAASELFGNEWRRLAGRRRKKCERAVAPGVPDSIKPAVAALRGEVRAAYELHAGGLGCREIGNRLKCSTATASRRVSQARKGIRAWVERSSQ